MKGDGKMSKIRIASLQMNVLQDKYDNIEQLAEILASGKTDGADIISLGEMWCCPYQTDLFPVYAEPEQEGDAWLAMSTLARKHNVYIVGGSIPESDSEGHTYNTCYVFDRQGNQIGKHRKVHLFDIYAHGEQVFKESDTLTGGDSFTTFDTEWCKMAVNICFDIRFPESSRLPALAGARVIFNPASFNMTTGPAHWDLSIRARALDNQVYFAAVSPARDDKGPYKAYGNSCIANPWGEFTAHTDARQGVLMGEIDTEYVDSIREQLPLLHHRRPELY